jgi:hypothetical protein
MSQKNGRAPQGVPIEIKFGSKTDTIYLHPDGAILGDTLGMQVKVEAMQRASKRFQQCERLVNAGTIDKEEYDEQLAALDAAKEKALAEAKDADGRNAIESQYRTAAASLLNARDGEPLPFEEYEKKERELDRWRMLASVKPVAVPFLRSCIIKWTLTDGQAPLPITTDSLNSLTDDWLMVAFTKASAHYQKDQLAEKKSLETSANGEAAKETSALPPNGSPVSPSQNAGALGQARSSDGESANTAKP